MTMSTNPVFSYPVRLATRRMPAGQEKPHGFIGVIDDVVLTSTTPYRVIWDLLNRLAADSANHAALHELQGGDQTRKHYQVIADPKTMTPDRWHVMRAVEHLDAARLEDARRLLVESAAFEECELYLGTADRDALTTPVDVALAATSPVRSHCDAVRRGFRAANDARRDQQRHNRSRGGGGPSRARRAQKAAKSQRDREERLKRRGGSAGGKNKNKAA